MTSTHRRLAAVSAVVVSLVAAPLAQRPAPVPGHDLAASRRVVVFNAVSRPVDPGLAASLQRSLDQWAMEPGHRGVTAAVILADGAEWTGAAGRAADDEAMRPEHLLGIASITKTMTAAVILQLVDEGVLQLDDPISRWLPPVPTSPAPASSLPRKPPTRCVRWAAASSTSTRP